jgi:hypothetical protein
MIDIVTVVNNYPLYDRCVRNNSFINTHKLVAIDNITNPKGIAELYNNYIKTGMKDDTWAVFCHQDFIFHESIMEKLNGLDKNSIYGAVGVYPEKEFVFFLRMKGIRIQKFKFGFVLRRWRYGRFLQGEGNGAHYKGKSVKGTKIVDTVDCCCIIVHSALIRKRQIMFDEQLKWHLYSEDFSLNAKKKHGIPTRVIQLNCQHLSQGNFSGDFEESLAYIKRKYPDDVFASTCFDGYYDVFKKSI